MDMSCTNRDDLTKYGKHRKKSPRLRIIEIHKSIATEPFSRSLYTRFEFTEGCNSFNEKREMFPRQER